MSQIPTKDACPTLCELYNMFHYVSCELLCKYSVAQTPCCDTGIRCSFITIIPILLCDLRPSNFVSLASLEYQLLTKYKANLLTTTLVWTPWLLRSRTRRAEPLDKFLTWKPATLWRYRPTCWENCRHRGCSSEQVVPSSTTTFTTSQILKVR